MPLRPAWLWFRLFLILPCILGVAACTAEGGKESLEAWRSRTFKTLIERVDKEDPAERRMACCVLKSFGAKAVPILITRLKDTDQTVRMIANYSLLCITGQDFRREYQKAVEWQKKNGPGK